jgi:hypothetical protein
MNETAVRAALRAATDDVEPYDVLGRALRQARRRRFTRLAAGPAAVVMVAAIALAGWVQTPAGSERPGKPRGSLAGLPDRLEDPRSRTPKVTARPPGVVAAAYTGGGYASLSDRLYVVLSGPAGYRVTDRWDRDEVYPGEELLLSPAGDQLALYEPGAVVVLDLTTGRRRTVPNPSGQAMEPLAWSPDNRTLAVAVAPDTGDDHRKSWRGLGLLDTGSGEYRSLANPAGSYTPGFAVAFSPDGQALAYQGDRHIFVVGLDGADRGDFWVEEEGDLLAGKGAFTPDGASVVVSAGTDCCTRYLEYHDVDEEYGPVGRRSGTVADASALRVQGWTPGGTPVAVAFRPVPGYASMPRTAPTRYDRVRRAEVLTVGTGTTLIGVPSGVAAVDLAERAVATGQVTAAPAAAYGLGPPFPLARPDLPIAAGYLLAVGFPTVLVGLLVYALLRRRVSGPAGSPPWRSARPARSDPDPREP